MCFYWYNKLPSVVFWFLIINPGHDFQLKTHSDAAFRHRWWEELWQKAWIYTENHHETSDFHGIDAVYHRKHFPKIWCWKTLNLVAHIWDKIHATLKERLALMTNFAGFIQFRYLQSNYIISFFNCCFGPSSSSPPWNKQNRQLAPPAEKPFQTECSPSFPVRTAGAFFLRPSGFPKP